MASLVSHHPQQQQQQQQHPHPLDKLQRPPPPGHPAPPLLPPQEDLKYQHQFQSTSPFQPVSNNVVLMASPTASEIISKGDS